MLGRLGADQDGYQLDGRQLAEGHLQLLIIADMDEWLAYQVSAHMPAKAGASIELHLQGGKRTLFEFAAKRGFAGVPLSCLRRLLRRRGLGDESSAKADVVRKLIKDAFPDMSDEDVAVCKSHDASSDEGACI